jgi:hypothetical protein
MYNNFDKIFIFAMQNIFHDSISEDRFLFFFLGEASFNIIKSLLAKFL